MSRQLRIIRINSISHSRIQHYHRHHAEMMCYDHLAVVMNRMLTFDRFDAIDRVVD